MLVLVVGKVAAVSSPSASKELPTEHSVSLLKVEQEQKMVMGVVWVILDAQSGRALEVRRLSSEVEGNSERK